MMARKDNNVVIDFGGSGDVPTFPRFDKGDFTKGDFTIHGSNTTEPGPSPKRMIPACRMQC